MVLVEKQEDRVENGVMMVEVPVIVEVLVLLVERLLVLIIL
jgi:hypothetical protein